MDPIYRLWQHALKRIRRRTARRRRRSVRGALAQPLILSPTKIYESAYRAKLARFFRRPQDGTRYLSTKIYKNIYAYVRAWISEGVGLPHAIRQPETARRQKKSGILELFPYRASGPFPALFYSLSDRVPTDVSIALPILARFLPTCSLIRTQVKRHPADDRSRFPAVRLLPRRSRDARSDRILDSTALTNRRSWDARSATVRPRGRRRRPIRSDSPLDRAVRSDPPDPSV